MVELPKNKTLINDEAGPYTVAAKQCKDLPHDFDINSTIVDYQGQWIELFGVAQHESQPLPYGYNMRATIVKKHINNQVRCVIVNLSETEN
ncbi:hypothetical protein GF369_04015 [Candidatus Peregrinibacteria bacterium]|nr:hypothetical protein [Candidatus Peregrinibacteria bacterium]